MGRETKGECDLSWWRWKRKKLKIETKPNYAFCEFADDQLVSWRGLNDKNGSFLANELFLVGFFLSSFKLRLKAKLSIFSNLWRLFIEKSKPILLKSIMR